METLILHPQNKTQLKALKSIAKALNIAFEEQKSNYNPELIASIKAAESNANFIEVDTNDPWGSILSK